MPGLPKSKSRRKSAIQMLGRRLPPPRSPLSRSEVERAGRASRWGSCLFQLYCGADHAVAEPERGDGELERHRRHAVRGRVDLECLAAVVEHVLDDAGRADPRQVVGADHPLVVLRDDLARLGEALRRRHRGRQRVDDAVVEPDHREVRLRDREVLVVPRVRYDALRGDSAPDRRAAGRTLVEAGRRLRCPTFRCSVVAVELRRARILRPDAVERVQIEARRPRLLDVRGRDVRPLHQRGLVEGQVVVDELAEVGEPGGDRPVGAVVARSSPARSSGGSARRAVCPSLLAPACEAELRHGRLDGGRRASIPAAEALAEEPSPRTK